jgi:serine/threonine-protein kinase
LLAQLRAVLAGEYEIERECGRGGMAAVFKAVDVSLRRPVALKVMFPAAAIGGAVVERLRREARMAAGLDHPNIVPIYRVAQAGGIHYIVMKFIEGRPLDAIVEAQGALPLPVVVAVMRAAASALAYAHERGTVHRDIKSSNILIDQEGRVYVSDFGLARAMEGDAKVTPSGAVVGTPLFMSPEQCAGDPVGPQGDQYSLGIVAFQMLAGAAPFEASSVLAVVQHQYFTPAPDIRRIREGIPDSLVDLIERLVAKDPAHRFISTSDLVSTLEALPFHDEEQRIAKETLRRLARGYRVPVVQTGALPPLPDARQTRAGAAGVQAGIRGAPPKPRAHAPLLTTLGIGTAALLTGAGVWWAVQASTSGAATPPPALDAASRAESTGAMRVRLESPTAPARPTARSRAAPARTSPAPTPSGTGLVRLRTAPADAAIYIDDRQVGVGTLFDVEVPAGTRRLRIRAPGSVTLDTTFVVQAGGTTRLGLIALGSLP